MTRFDSLDLSGNPLAFFCIDALVTSLKSMESATPSRSPCHPQSQCMEMSPEQLESQATTCDALLKLNLSGTRLDELSAYQLCLGVLQHSFIECLDLSNNVQLGHSFARTLEQLLTSMRFKYTLKRVSLAQTSVSTQSMIRINKIIAKNRAQTVQDASVNRLYFPNKQQVPASQHQSVACSQICTP